MFGLIAKVTFSVIKVTINIVKEEKIDDNEEYLKIKETVNQVKINNAANPYDNAHKIPKKVATPFPPLNFNQTGRT